MPPPPPPPAAPRPPPRAASCSNMAMTSGSTSCPPLPQPIISTSRSQMVACDGAWKDMDRACWKETSVSPSLSPWACGRCGLTRSHAPRLFRPAPYIPSRGTATESDRAETRAGRRARYGTGRGRKGEEGTERREAGMVPSRGERARQAKDGQGGKVLLCCLVSLRRGRWRFLCLAAPEKLPLGSSH
jgi:hypothetical protein